MSKQESSAFSKPLCQVKILAIYPTLFPLSKAKMYMLQRRNTVSPISEYILLKGVLHKEFMPNKYTL